MQATSLSIVDTLYSADAVEFCPLNPRLFAVGTYQIEKDESTVPAPAPPPAAGDDDSSDEEDAPRAVEPVVTRYGRCLLYEIDEEGGNLSVILFPAQQIASTADEPRLATDEKLSDSTVLLSST